MNSHKNLSMLLRCFLLLVISVFAADLEGAARFQNRLIAKQELSNPETRRFLMELKKLSDTMEREDFVNLVKSRFLNERRGLIIDVPLLCEITGVCDDIVEGTAAFVCNGDHSCAAYEELGLHIHSLAELTVDHLSQITLENLESLIQDVWDFLSCSPLDCFLDFSIDGCMPDSNACRIVYGHSCLAISESIGRSVTHEFNAATKHSEGAVAFTAGAQASINSQALLILDLANGANFRVELSMPTIEIHAKAEIEFSSSGGFDSGEKRVTLAERNEFFTQTFMAGAIPVMLKIAVQPVAILSASGNVDASGHVTYSVDGEVGFEVGDCSDTSCPLYMEVPLDFSEIKNNFNADIRPTVEVDHGFDWSFAGTADLNLEARVGVEISISVQNMIEFNLFPSVKTTFEVNGNIEMGKDADALAGASGSLCFGADFEAYLDYAETGNGRRALGTQVDVLDTIEGLCDSAFDAMGCDFVDTLSEIANVCGLAREVLNALGIETTITLPDLGSFPINIQGVCETFEATVTSGGSSGNAPQPSLPSPNTQFRALDGCSSRNGMRRGQRPRWATLNQRFEVQCCSQNGQRCTRYHRGRVCISGNNNMHKMTWYQARNACASIGMRLCRNQQELNRCCRSGCAHDVDLVWTGIRRRA